VRPIVAEVGILPRAHGSALFTRGETQALVVATLGTGEDEQFIDALEGTYKEKLPAALQLPSLFGRRNRPHGRAQAAAKSATASWPGARSIRCCRPQGRIPLHDPRGLGDHRVQRLVVDGDGLRRLAGADGCGRAAEAADRGHRHGPDPGRHALAVLSDILGDEDHLGDMDFKVAGTEDGITSLQMDIKIAGITEEIMKVALARPRTAACTSWARWPRRSTGARAELGEYAPRIETIKIPTDKIREVIGTGGKVIREIVEKTGAKINIETTAR
jgi:polyribonucleotide nucleotidyltransferase